MALPIVVLAASTVLAIPVLAVEPIELRLVLTVERASDHVKIFCRVENTGTEPAYDVQADLWQAEGARQTLAGELLPDAAVDATWKFTSTDWIGRLHQIAAVRVRYRDVSHTWASSATALGAKTSATVRAPEWPRRPHLGVEWTDPPATSGRVIWWGPAEIVVTGPEVWRAIDRRLTITGELKPPIDITGWNTWVFALLVPDDIAAPGWVVQVPIDARSRIALWRPDWWLLARYASLCLVVWLIAGLAARARWAPAGAGWLGALPFLTVALCLGAVALTIFPPRLLMLDTTPAGGDFASQIVALDYLKQQLLPHWTVYGWYLGQYGGFPLFLFYFPLAFVLVVLLSVALPLTVALKIGSLSGAILLPCAWYWTLRWLDAPRPAAWCGAAASLWLLLLEAHSTWGGNLASTLAGEFGYGLGYPLAWLTMAYGWKARDRESDWWPVPLLLALTGLAHGYTLIVAAIGLMLLTIDPQRWWRRSWSVARSGLLAFGLLAWWLVPLLWNLPWTNSFRERWSIGRFEQFLPPILWPAVALIALGTIHRLMSCLRNGMRTPAGPRRLGPAAQWWLLGFAAAMAIVYKLGYSLGVVDIRFLPMLHGAIILGGCWVLGHWIAWLPPRVRPPALALAVVGISVMAAAQVRYLPLWARWTLGGMERTPRWRDYEGVMRQVSGRLTDPRVVFEHHPDHNAAGTIRAFELLPYFARRATLEGLYMQSALLAPAVFYIQSEMSLHPSCPLPDYECGRFDPAAAVPHLRLFGVDTIVAYSDSLKTELRKVAGVQERGTSGVYSVFVVSEPTRLVEPVRFRPVADAYEDWRTESYDWFRAATDLEVPLVFGRRSVSTDLSVSRYKPGELPTVPYDSRPSVSYELDHDHMRIVTDTPGHPLLVKVAYHPGWRASDGSSIELVAPGMMLVTPRTKTVALRWTSGWAGWLGLLLTAATLGLIGMSVLAGGPPLSKLPADAGIRGRVGVAFTLAVCGLFAGSMYARHPPLDFADLLAQGNRHLAARDYASAEDRYRRMMAGTTRHPLRDDAGFYYGLAATEAGRSGAAVERWESFLSEFPVSVYRTEVLVRLSRLHLARGEIERARDSLREAVVAPLSPPNWRETARLELERL